jgi:hypothetical protein
MQPSLSKGIFSQYIKGFQFRELFNEMGWNNDRTKNTIIIDEKSYTLIGVGEKSKFYIFMCTPVEGNKIPDKVTRKKIEAKVTKLFQEHLIIFINNEKTEQIWQLAVRISGTPTKISELPYNISQDPELLYQRASGIFFTLDEEEKVTIVTVTKRVADNFQQNNEKVTKKFYENFRKEHTCFIKFIKGIEDKVNQDWYASLMLNRLMFCYFIQKKGFLDNNINYLQDKMNECKEKKGKNKFYSFYKDFLLVLFHQGLGNLERDKDLAVKIGRVPYLNGGLFEVHEIEKMFKKIDIDDKAFERLFNFFDEYEWHLDTRKTASGNDINPDVIGYIFEKYINDRAEMGAYYTKEDITDYVSKNCIIPWIFDEIKCKYPDAFSTNGWIWQKVKNSGVQYIYDTIKYGIPKTGGLFDDLPHKIIKGLNFELESKIIEESAGPHLYELREDWNEQAPKEIALPTETYREVIERRKRFIDLKQRIAEGKINNIDDFITYNLDIRQFVQDILEETSDYEFIKFFYKAIESVKILDPTCGSGAFLFSAMNILEALYESCINRMIEFVSIAEKDKCKFFIEVLNNINSPHHANLKYFIFKSIILNNLYGVDIMKEAVEIAKLRLFLKLVATVDINYNKPNLGLEPLPDIDFNIRSGNSIIGYANKSQIENIIGMFVTAAHKKKIIEQCDIVARTYLKYKETQLFISNEAQDYKKAKDDLNCKLKLLTSDLDKILFMDQYDGIEPIGKSYDSWLESHKPFHWYAEFFEILNESNGFDIVIGNPPYVEYSTVRAKYTIKNYKTEKSANLYSFIAERSVCLSTDKAKIGLILPLSAFCTQRMEIMNELLKLSSNSIYISNYSFRPSKLFEGANRTISIGLFSKGNDETKRIYTTTYMKWSSDYREHLFFNLKYFNVPILFKMNQFPKIDFEVQLSILNKLFTNKHIIAEQLTKDKNQNCIYYRNVGGLYWKIITDFKPKFYEDGKLTSSSRESHLYFRDEMSCKLALALYNSNLFWFWYITMCDCWALNPTDLINFRFDVSAINKNISKKIVNLASELMIDLKKNVAWAERIHKGKNKTKFQQFTPRLSKRLIDKIDFELSTLYGFSEDELDCLIHYDSKYRMGHDSDSGEE